HYRTHGREKRSGQGLIHMKPMESEQPSPLLGKDVGHVSRMAEGRVAVGKIEGCGTNIPRSKLGRLLWRSASKWCRFSPRARRALQACTPQTHLSSNSS